jgi:hypothetical protein
MLNLPMTKDHALRAVVSCSECPIALALLDATESRWIVGVKAARDDCTVMYPARRPDIRIPVPPDMLQFIATWDRHRIISARQFSLDIPEEAFRLGDPRADLERLRMFTGTMSPAYRRDSSSMARIAAGGVGW